MLKENVMGKYAIVTSVLENYAAHNDDWDGETFYWKNKSGSTYLVYAENEAEARSVIKLVTSKNDSYIESKQDFFPVAEEFTSEFVRDQKKYDPEGYDTLYLDPVIRKGKSGDWYLKRGYIAGKFNQDRPQFAHLAGAECCWVDNLNTGKCVLRIEGDVRTPIEDD